MTVRPWFHPTVQAQLTELARQHHHKATNWWREEHYKSRRAARCLICGMVMHTWPADRPIPFAANSSIVAHYEYHAMRVVTR